MTIVYAASAVAISGRAVLIEGEPGSGKSSLALALIDRGAVLIGDDAVTLERRDAMLFAGPPPNVAGLVEVRNVGLIRLATASDIAVALVLRLDRAAPRFIEKAERAKLYGAELPLVRLWPDSPVLHLRAEAALARYGAE